MVSLGNDFFGEEKIMLAVIEKYENCYRDLAGWHVCLDVIHTLLDGRIMITR
jgi:hypothetical protein